MIDGCLALNVSPDYKYERNFRSQRDGAHIRDGVLFNALIFNYDAHGKNISFFLGSRGLTLAPFYDLANIKMYPEFEHSDLRNQKYTHRNWFHYSGSVVYFLRQKTEV